MSFAQLSETEDLVLHHVKTSEQPTSRNHIQEHVGARTGFDKVETALRKLVARGILGYENDQYFLKSA